MATPWSAFGSGPRPAWAPQPFKTPFMVPVPVPVPVPVSSRAGRSSRGFQPAPGPLTGQFPGPVFGAPDPRVAAAAAGTPFAQVPFSRQGPVSTPAPQSNGPDFMAMLGQYLNQQGPPGMGPMTPQRGNEMRISYGGRRAGNAAGNAMGLTVSGAAPLLYQGGKAVAGEVKNAFDYLTATPDSDLHKAFAAMIQQESGGNQAAVSPKGAVGVAQVMPGTGPEAAKLAGLPWDPQRYKNDPNYNAALGFAYFKQQVKANNGDVLKAMAAYNGGPGTLRQAEAKAAQTGQPWMAFMKPETQNYVPSVLQRMGALANNFGAPAPGFNAAPYQNAMAAQDEAAKLLSTPFSAQMNYQPLPDRPKPTELQAPDFSAGNAAFEQIRPTNPFDDPREVGRIQRRGYFKGIGQAMASLSGGEGIGTLLMRLGSGALMGRAAGDDQVEAKQEEFDREMRAFNLALANRSDQQAVTSANILNQNIAQRNQYAEAIWQDNVQQIQKFQPQVQGDKLITFAPDPADPNKKTMTVTPLGFGIQAEALLNKANIGVQMGQAEAASSQFAYSSQQATARTALGLTTQLAMQNGNPQAAQEGYLTEAANRARATVRTGNWKDLFGNDTSNITGQLETHAQQQAYQQLGVPLRPDGQPQMPLEGSSLARFQEIYEDNLTNSIYEMALKAGTVDKLFMMAPAHTAYTTQRGKQQRESQRTDSRGRTSYSTSWDMGD